MRHTRRRVPCAVAALLAAVAVANALAEAQISPARTDSIRRAGAADTARAIRGRDSSLTPAPDQARGVDAEIRVALFELTSGKPLAALSRLEWMRSSPVALTGVGAGGALLAREELLFLLSQAYYRLGMTDAFRTAAQQLTPAGGGRFAGLLRLQLLVDAYRRGDYAQAIALGGNAAPQDRGLGALVVGLANYNSRSYPAARAAFDAAAQAGGAYASYARYMSVLAALAGDTARAGGAADSLRALAGQAPGTFADQVNLTAAQLVYQRGQFDAAASLAANVAEGSGLAAEALLTRAWALYKANQLDGAGTAFRDFAARYPQLPERDEARVMVGQVMLQAGRTDEAGQHFRIIADSIGSEVGALQARAGSAMTDAARALVAARATGLLFLNAPAEGKTIALPDEQLAMSLSALAAALGGAPAAGADSVAPQLVSITDVEARLSGLNPPLASGFPRRLVYVHAAGGTQPAAYVQRSAALRQADVAVALARYRLQEVLDAHAAKVALLQRLQQMLGDEGGRLTDAATRLGALRDSLAKVAATIDATRARLRDVIRGEAESVRQLAAENESRADSLRRAAMGPLTPEDQSIVDVETSTAGIYRQLADAVAAGVDQALARHAVVRLRDTVRARSDRVQALLGETQGLLATTRQTVGDEIARLERTGSERAAAARATLATAEGRRGTAEAQLVAAVEAELRARADRLVAIMRHDNEAAEFGAASAAFFKAVDAGRTSGTSGSGANGTGAPEGGTAGGTREGQPASPAPPAVPPAGSARAGRPPTGKPTSPR